MQVSKTYGQMAYHTICC